MLAHEPDDGVAGQAERPAAERPAAEWARAAAGWTATPDREVLDAARFRLSARDGSPVAEPSLTGTLDDIRAVARVRLAARYGTQPSPGPLDLGASLVLLGNLRLHLDALEADVLEASVDLGMSWDLIAAITGIPAAEARHRLRELRAHPHPR